MNTKALAYLAGIAAVAFALAPLTGCETESASQDSITVSPAAVGMRINETREFVATGGYTYTWSLEHEDWGILTTRKGPRTVYINRFNPTATNTANIQVITVTSTIGTSEGDGTSTNTVATPTGGSPSFTKTGSAVIEHLPTAVTPP